MAGRACALAALTLRACGQVSSGGDVRVVSGVGGKGISCMQLSGGTGLGPDGAQRLADLLRELKKARVSAAALADLYIPEAARRMGDAWTDDQMSWLDVSIGVGRLQSLLREIGMAWVADQAGDTGHGTVLLIVPDREQHTLGPMVAMGQMRRYGVSVCLRIAPSHNELRSLMVARQFDGVLISIATKDKLESVSNTVQFIKAVAGKPMPIVVGGAVTPKVEDLAAATGADLASNDICEALESLGLKFDASCVLRRA